MTENPWIEWNGGECPVAPETIVDVRFPDGEEETGIRAAFWAGPSVDWWRHESDDPDCHIIAYRVTQP